MPFGVKQPIFLLYLENIRICAVWFDFNWIVILGVYYSLLFRLRFDNNGSLIILVRIILQFWLIISKRRTGLYLLQ